MAGINAHLKLVGKDPFILRRDEAYIGVLIDDLITKGVDEPYRMFTSRSEYRILLRQDNADLRLTGKSYQIGLATEERYRRMSEKYTEVDSLLDYCNTKTVKAIQINEYLNSKNSALLTESKKLSDIVSRPEVKLSEILQIVPRGTFSPEVMDSVEIMIKYKPYIERESQEAKKLQTLENLIIPEDFDFDRVSGLSIECRQKLKKYSPRNIAQASRISGVSPSDISVLLVYFGR